MLTRFQVVLQLVKQTLQKGLALHSDVTECVRGLVLPLLVRFDYISDPDGVAAVTRITIVGRDCFVEVLIRVLPCAKLLGALIENLLDRDALGDNDQPVEAFAALWDLETCEAELRDRSERGRSSATQPTSGWWSTPSSTSRTWFGCLR